MPRYSDDLDSIKQRAREAAEVHSAWVFQSLYAGADPGPFIDTRVPAKTQTVFIRLFTHDYEHLLDCSAAVARRHLRLLVSEGFLTEKRTQGGCTSWYFVDEAERVAIGERIIKRLRERGLKFKDER